MTARFPKAAQYLLRYGYDPTMIFVDGIFSDGFVSPMTPPANRSVGSMSRRTFGDHGRKAYVWRWNRTDGFNYRELCRLAAEDAAARNDYEYTPRRGIHHSGETFL